MWFVGVFGNYLHNIMTNFHNQWVKIRNFFFSDLEPQYIKRFLHGKACIYEYRRYEGQNIICWSGIVAILSSTRRQFSKTKY
jgi:hypothetical protein